MEASSSTNSNHREWFCHICQTDIEPLLTPDPICPNCHESFIEQTESSQDDPHDFALPDEPFINNNNGNANVRSFQSLFQAFLGFTGNSPQPPFHQEPQPDDDGGGLFAQAEHGQPYGLPTPAQAAHQAAERRLNSNPSSPSSPSSVASPQPVRNLAEFLNGAFAVPSEGHTNANDRPPRTNPSTTTNANDSDNENRALPNNLAQMLMSIMGAVGGNAPEQGRGGVQFSFSTGPGGMGMQFVRGGNATGGFNLGDYAFNQESLDNIITQLMEQAAGHYGPRPATEEVMAEIPRFTMSEDLLSHDTVGECAICRDDFAKGDTCMKLPCTHVYHQDCLIPWLKQNGTCPVCRFALVEQPASAPTSPIIETSASGNQPRPPSRSRSTNITLEGSTLPMTLPPFIRTQPPRPVPQYELPEPEDVD